MRSEANGVGPGSRLVQSMRGFEQADVDVPATVDPVPAIDVTLKRAARRR
jgi:hypothetical protein